jgi:hypothetical protein
LAPSRPDLSPGLVRIIETALAKSPGDRHATLEAMNAALEQEVQGAAPLLRVPTPGRGLALGSPIESGSERRKTPVDALLHREPPADHRATRFLAGFPLEAAAGQRRQTSRLAPLRWLRGRRWLAWASLGLLGLMVGIALVLWTGRAGRASAHLPALAVSARAPASSEITPLRTPTVVPTPSPSPAARDEDASLAPTPAAVRPRVAAPAAVRPRVAAPAGKPKARASNNRSRAGSLTAADF